MYPLLTINTDYITENAKEIVKRAKQNGVSITAVTKCFGGNREVASALLKGGIKIIGDSRIANLEKFKDLPCQKWMIRIPSLSECDQIVEYADVSLNSEITTIRQLNHSAFKKGVRHGVILMIDVGDLREGWFLGDGTSESTEVDNLMDNSVAEIMNTIIEILSMSNIDFVGIGANETCFGGVIPTPSTFKEIIWLKQYIEKSFNIACPVISGGNSSSYHLLDSNILPSDINNLRLGELILFGREPAMNICYSYLHQDSFILHVEIVELKNKPSVPVGKIGRDAFGKIPHFEDKGIRKRAICALGRQDTDVDNLTPLDKGMTIEGASSDHMIIDITGSRKKYKVGDVIKLVCNYSSALHICTSEYIEKKTRNRFF